MVKHQLETYATGKFPLLQQPSGLGHSEDLQESTVTTVAMSGLTQAKRIFVQADGTHLVLTNVLGHCFRFPTWGGSPLSPTNCFIIRIASPWIGLEARWWWTRGGIICVTIDISCHEE